MNYEELSKSLRICGHWKADVRFPGKDGCDGCAYHDEANNVCNSWDADNRKENIMLQAADAIEDLENKLNLWRQDKISRWIPVTERLPEEEESVFVVRKFLGVKGQVPPSTYTEIAYRIGDRWVADSDEYKIARYRHTDPLYWMPLPAPPKEDA